MARHLPRPKPPRCRARASKSATVPARPTSRSGLIPSGASSSRGMPRRNCSASARACSPCGCVPGTYSVQLELSGFQTITRENIVVLVGQTTPVEFTMKVAGVSANITVTGASGRQSVSIDISGGAFAPSFSNASGEILFHVNLGAGTDRLSVYGSAAADHHGPAARSNRQPGQ